MHPCLKGLLLELTQGEDRKRSLIQEKPGSGEVSRDALHMMSCDSFETDSRLWEQRTRCLIAVQLFPIRTEVGFFR